MAYKIKKKRKAKFKSFSALILSGSAAKIT
jgi:hypothetical protein